MKKADKMWSKQITAALMTLAVMCLIAACSGSGGPAAEKKKSVTWDDTSIEVKDITDDESVIGENKNGISGKCVAVILDLGEAEMAQSTFENNVNSGKLLLKGQKPKNYNYHMGNMAFGANGFEAKITGEVMVFFDMDPDYEVSINDLEIKE